MDPRPQSVTVPIAPTARGAETERASRARANLVSLARQEDESAERRADGGVVSDPADWPLVVCLAGAFVLALVRVVYTVAHRAAFGPDESLALVFLLGVPLLLLEPAAGLARGFRRGPRSTARADQPGA